MKKYLLLIGFLWLLISSAKSQQLIQGTLKTGAGTGSIEVWLKPNFNNNVQYLFQIGMPIAFPASASPQPTGLNITLDPGFIAAFGNNYTVTVNPVATATGGTEKYFNIVLVRGGLGASNAQTWTAGTEFKVLTFTFSPSTAPASQVKLADYQDGGSDGLGNFYTQSGNNDYYITANSVGNFYATVGQSTAGGTVAAGYAQTIATIPPPVCTTPSVPVVNNITTTTADINWTAVSGTLGYEYAITMSSTPPVSGTATTAITYAATGLMPNTQYYAHLRSSCAGGSFSSWVSTAFMTQNASCTAPSSPVITNISSTGADINWGTVSGVAGYEYAVTTSSTAPASGTATTATTYTATSLISGTTYYIHVRSDCGSGLSSSWVSTPFNTTCPATTTPVISAITAAGAVIDWTPVGGGASGYEYAITTNSTPPTSGTATTATTYTASGLSAGTLYYVYIRTACTAGNFSSWENTTFTTLCPATTIPVVSNTTTTGAIINWTAISGTTGYEYAITTSSTPPTSGTATTLTTYTATGLTPGTSYYVYIRSSCSPGIFSEWASSTFTTLYPPCTAPTIPVVTNLGDSANISWGTVSGVVGYEYALTNSSTPPASGTFTTATNYQATGLSSVTQYYVHVRSSCAAGIFSPWVTKAFSTACLAPFVITGTVNGNSADMNWSSVNGAINYEYALTTYLAPPVNGVVISDTTQHLPNLSAGVGYYFHVRTNCAAGGFSEWSTYTFHTPGLEAYPNPVRNNLTINVYGVSSISNGQLSIYDAAGKLITTGTLVNNSIIINTRAFASGIYLIKYTDGKQKYTVKVMKQ
jgi:hypothetical protein